VAHLSATATVFQQQLYLGIFIMKKLIIAALAIAVSFGATSAFAQDAAKPAKTMKKHMGHKKGHRHHKKAAAATK
ncbi:MAG: hypothetical protein ABI876_09515, partial [Bacteroidota bacterium]